MRRRVALLTCPFASLHIARSSDLRLPASHPPLPPIMLVRLCSVLLLLAATVQASGLTRDDLKWARRTLHARRLARRAAPSATVGASSQIVTGALNDCPAYGDATFTRSSREFQPDDTSDSPCAYRPVFGASLTSRRPVVLVPGPRPGDPGLSRPDPVVRYLQLQRARRAVRIQFQLVRRVARLSYGLTGCAQRHTDNLRRDARCSIHHMPCDGRPGQRTGAVGRVGRRRHLAVDRPFVSVAQVRRIAGSTRSRLTLEAAPTTTPTAPRAFCAATTRSVVVRTRPRTTPVASSSASTRCCDPCAECHQ